MKVPSYKSKVLKSNSTILSIHPEALPAFNIWKDTFQQIKVDELPGIAITNLMHQHPLRVLLDSVGSRKKIKKYYVISGWYFLDQVQKYRVEEIECLEANFSGYSNKEIAEYIAHSANAYACSLVVTTPHRKTTISYLHKLLSTQGIVARSIMQGKACIKPVIERITGESRTSVRTQLKPVNKTGSDIDPPIL